MIDPKHTLSVKGKLWCDVDRGLDGAINLGPVARNCYVLKSCVCNVHNAICNRHLKRQENPVVGDFSFAEQLFQQHASVLEGEYNRQWAYYVENWDKKWTKPKLDAIEKSEMFDMLDDEDHLKVKPFPKTECNHSMPTKARLIQGAAQFAAQKSVAIDVCAMQKSFASVFSLRYQPGKVHITFASGMNATALGDWMRDTYDLFGKVHFYERDGKNWDANIQRRHWQLKIATYLLMCGDKYVLKLLNSMFVAKGRYKCRFSDAILKYVVEGTVKSGHADTSLGNSIINAAIAACVANSMGLRVRILVMGDDLLMAVEGDFDADEFAKREKDYGIVPEYRKFSSWLDVSFISAQWWPTGNVCHPFVATPKFGRCLARLFWTHKMVPKRDRKAWVHSVCSGIIQSVKDIPCFGPWLKRCDELAGTERLVATGKYSELNANVTVDASRELCLEAFKRRYSLPEWEVLALESQLASLPSLQVWLNTRTVQHIVNSDTADLLDRPTHA